jgi:hypothetical protein
MHTAERRTSRRTLIWHIVTGILIAIYVAIVAYVMLGWGNNYQRVDSHDPESWTFKERNGSTTLRY